MKEDWTAATLSRWHNLFDKRLEKAVYWWWGCSTTWAKCFTLQCIPVLKHLCPPHDACLHGGRFKRLNQDAQAVTRACKGAIHWKLDGELISSALLGHGLLIASGMPSPFQAHSLQVKKHVLRSYGDWWRSQMWSHQCSGVYWSTQFSNSSHSTPLALIAGLMVFQCGAAAAYTA